MAMNEHSANLSREGRVLIPAALRKQLTLKPGDALTLSPQQCRLRWFDPTTTLAVA